MDVIDVNQDKAMEVLLDHLTHEPLEYRGGTDQAILHDAVV